MSTLDDVLLYLCRKYPLPAELSKARLTKLVYLADWESAMTTGKQLTAIRWYFHNFGPYVDDVIESARRSPGLEVVRTENMYGEPKELVRIKKGAPDPKLNSQDEQILDEVIAETKKYYWNDFIKHVYDTYPVANGERYSELDLPKLAREAKSKGHRARVPV
jgi:hypothetical protein